MEQRNNGITFYWHNCICLRWDLIWSMQCPCGILTASFISQHWKESRSLPLRLPSNPGTIAMGLCSWDLASSNCRNVTASHIWGCAIYLFQIINGNFVFPNPPIVRRQLEHDLRNVTHHFMQPFARTTAYQYSFFPNTISDWNSLPASIRSCPSITAFKL